MINRILLILALAVPVLYVSELQAAPSPAIVARVHQMQEMLDAEEAKVLSLYEAGDLTADQRDALLDLVEANRSAAKYLLTL